jgi:hypothetical protein
MESVSLVATSAYPYAGKSLVAGEVFTASKQDADLLKLIKRAVDAPEAPMVKMRALRAFERIAAGVRYARGEVFMAHDVEAIGLERYGKAEPVGDDVAPAVDEPKQKRRYRRRDLQAET